MKTKTLKKEFEKYLKENARTLNKLTVISGVDSMSSFYADKRVENSSLENDGDMLLYESGVFDWGEGPNLEKNISRQIIEENSGDGDIWQLTLIFKFSPESENSDLDDFNEWCKLPEKVNDFLKLLNSRKEIELYGDKHPGSIELQFRNAG